MLKHQTRHHAEAPLFGIYNCRHHHSHQQSVIVVGQNDKTNKIRSGRWAFQLASIVGNCQCQMYKQLYWQHDWQVFWQNVAHTFPTCLCLLRWSYFNYALGFLPSGPHQVSSSLLLFGQMSAIWILSIMYNLCTFHMHPFPNLLLILYSYKLVCHKTILKWQIRLSINMTVFISVQWCPL